MVVMQPYSSCSAHTPVVSYLHVRTQSEHEDDGMAANVCVAEWVDACKIVGMLMMLRHVAVDNDAWAEEVVLQFLHVLEIRYCLMYRTPMHLHCHPMPLHPRMARLLLRQEMLMRGALCQHHCRTNQCSPCGNRDVTHRHWRQRQERVAQKWMKRMRQLCAAFHHWNQSMLIVHSMVH